MIIEEALKVYLGTVASLTALISTRIYPNKLPQEPMLPAIKYETVSTNRDPLIDYVSKSIQYTLVSTTYSGAEQLAAVFRKALHRERRMMSGIRVEQIVLDPDIPAVGPLFEETFKVYYVIQTYKINYWEE